MLSSVLGSAGNLTEMQCDPLYQTLWGRGPGLDLPSGRPDVCSAGLRIAGLSCFRHFPEDPSHPLPDSTLLQGPSAVLGSSSWQHQPDTVEGSPVLRRGSPVGFSPKTHPELLMPGHWGPWSLLPASKPHLRLPSPLCFCLPPRRSLRGRRWLVVLDAFASRSQHPTRRDPGTMALRLHSGKNAERSISPVGVYSRGAKRTNVTASLTG